MASKEGQPVPKPEFPSSINFEIRNPAYLYKNVFEDRTLTDSGLPLPIIADGQKPHLYQDHLSNSFVFSLFISPLHCGKHLRKFVQSEAERHYFETQLKTYVDGSLFIRDNKVFRLLESHLGDTKEEEEIVLLPGGQENSERFYYNPKIKGIHSQNEFMEELTSCLKILQIYVTELYRTNGVSVPAETIVIEREERAEQGYHGRSMRDIMKEGENEQIEILRQAIIIEERPEISFADIGGQKIAVAEAMRLADQLQHPEAFTRWGVEPPRGILFFGEPGTGKTLLAKAMARHTNTPFIYVKASDLGSMWYGQSEKLAQQVFKIAKDEAQKKAGHAILYLDEVDAIMPPRNRGLHEATRRVVGEFLQQIDGLQTHGEITVLASTNRPEDVDNAFLSRMTAWIEVPLPDEDGITDIFAIHFRQREQKAGRRLLADSVDFSQVSKILKGVSGRDIADIVQIVLSTKGECELQGENVPLVSEADIRVAAERSSKVREAQRNQRRNQGMGFRQPTS